MDYSPPDPRLVRLATLFAGVPGVQVLSTDRGAVVRRTFPGRFSDSSEIASQWGIEAREIIGEAARLDQAPGLVGIGDATMIEMHFALPTPAGRAITLTIDDGGAGWINGAMAPVDRASEPGPVVTISAERLTGSA